MYNKNKKDKKMKLTDIDNFFDKSDNKDIIGIKFEKSIQPLETFKYNENLPNNAEVWLNLKAISSSYDYTGLQFSMTKIDDKYYLFEDHYKKYSTNYTCYNTYNNSEDAINVILRTLKNEAMYGDLDKWLIYKEC